MTQQQLLRDYTSLPEEARRQLDDFLALLQRRYGVGANQLAQAAPLEKEDFVGMWADRRDINEGATWVRDLRDAEWGGRQ